MAPKNKKNGFIFYCEERGQIDPDLRGKKLHDLVDLCSSGWNSMSGDEKQKYTDMAKDHNSGYYGNPPPKRASQFRGRRDSASSLRENRSQIRGRFDSFGRSMLALYSKEEYRTYLTSVMVKDVQLRVQELSLGDLMEQRFHVAHVNPWYETSNAIEDDVFEETYVVPAELGMCQFSLRQGVQKALNYKISPGAVQPGFMSSVKRNSEGIHDLDWNDPGLTGDYLGVINAVANLVRASGNERPADVDVHADFACLRGVDEGANGGVLTTDEMDVSAAQKFIREEEAKRGPKRLLPIFCLGSHINTCERAFSWLLHKAGKKVSWSCSIQSKLFIASLPKSCGSGTVRVQWVYSGHLGSGLKWPQ